MKNQLSLSAIVLLLIAPMGFASTTDDVEQLKKETKILKKQVKDLKKDSLNRSRTFLGDENLFFGLGSTYDGAKLLINEPSINKDLALLNQRKYIDKQYGPVSAQGPRVEFSGTVGSEAIFHTDRFGGDLGQAENYLSANADLDISAQVNDWFTVYTKFSGDTDTQNVGFNSGFVTVGNLDKSPVYGSVGQYYLANGYYGTHLLSPSLVRILGRTKAKAFSVGYVNNNGINVSAYVHNGTVFKNGKTRFDQYGVNVDYNSDFPVLDNDDVKVQLGASYINNIASSEGISAIIGGLNNPNAVIQHYVPAVNARAVISYSPFDFSAEYLTATKSFSATDLALNSKGVRPSSYQVEGTYNFKTMAKDSYVSLNYGATKQALPIQLPKKQYGVGYGVYIYKNTVLSFEHVMKKDYATGNVASNIGSLNPISGTGKTDHVSSVEVDVYF